MRVIIVVEHSNIDSYRVVTRTSEQPVVHQVIERGFEFNETACDFAEAFQDGLEFAGFETKLVVSEHIITDRIETIYFDEDRSRSFDSIWEKLS